MLEKLKTLFGDKQLNYDDFAKMITESGIKLTDLLDGNYVDKKKFEDEVNKLNSDLKTKSEELVKTAQASNGSQEANKELEKLIAAKTDLEKKLGETSNQLGQLSKRELARSKTGINDEDFLDLMLSRYGSKENADFDTAVTNYTNVSGEKWKIQTSPSPNLNGKPQSNEDEEFAVMKKAAGLK